MPDTSAEEDKAAGHIGAQFADYEIQEDPLVQLDSGREVQMENILKIKLSMSSPGSKMLPPPALYAAIAIPGCGG